MVTWQNYEEYMMMLVDGELSQPEEQALMAFVAQHHELKSELDAYNKTRLVPETVVYEQKEQLLKKEPARRAIAFPNWQRYSIAAGVAAIMMLSAYRLWMGDDTAGNRVAITVPPATKTGTSSPAQRAAVNPAPTPVVETPMPAQKQAIAKVEHKAQPVFNHPQPVVEVVKTVAAAKEEIKALAVAEPVAIAGQIETPSVAMAAEPPLAEIAPSAERSEMIDGLPLGVQRKESMQAVAANVANKFEHKKEAVNNAVASALDKVQNVREGLHVKDLVVRIEKKRLILSF